LEEKRRKGDASFAYLAETDEAKYKPFCIREWGCDFGGDASVDMILRYYQ
jgi:hypothetical protein